MEIIIDGTNLIAGRLATYSAKKALLGYGVIIVNADKVVITGKKETILAKFKSKIQRGDVFKGPFISRMPDRLLRRMIRGMLPYKQYKGKTAFKRIMCYIGIPNSLKDKKPITLKNADVSKIKATKFLTLAEISKLLK